MTQYTSLATKLVDSIYDTQENILVRKGKGKGITYIFFSGNGLFFPNTDECFQKTVVENNRYEWTNVAKSVEKNAEQIIFVRDVYKRWYAKGVSNRLPNVQSLCKYLKELCGTTKIYTVGNSAGAYMAILAGCLIDADYAFAFNPQIDLSFVDENDHPHIVELAKSDPYCHLQNFEFKTKVLLFYAAKNQADLLHSDLVKSKKNYVFYPFDETLHGKTMLAVNYPTVLNRPEKIAKIQLKQPISARKFLFLTCGKYQGIILYLKSIWTRGIRKIIKK